MMNKPNILIIVAHDLGKHIEPCGAKTVSTPNLQRMAQCGTGFHNHYCTSPGCSPSRASIFTGDYPHQTGVMGLAHGDFLWELSRPETHLAHTMARAGYETAAIGHWHEHRRFPELGYQQTVSRANGRLEISTDLKNYDDVIDAVDLAERTDYFLSRPGRGQTPFYLYCGIFEPHRPFDFNGVKPDREKGVEIPAYIPCATPEQKDAAEKEFAEFQGAIKAMDAAVGRIFQALEQSGLAENTIVLFTADHGAAMPRAKCSLYDPGIETPLMLCGPGIRPGREFRQLASNIDILPTVLDLCGIVSKHPIAGLSLLPLMTGRTDTHRDAVFAEKTYHKSYDPIRCIRTERWKYIVNFELNTLYDAPSDIQTGAIYRTSVEQYMKLRPRVELYDLQSDPWEQSNLADDSMVASVKKELHEKLLNWMRGTSDPLLNGPVQSVYYEKMMKESTERNQR